MAGPYAWHQGLGREGACETRGFQPWGHRVTLTAPFWGGRSGGRWGKRMDGVTAIHLVAIVVPRQCCMSPGHWPSQPPPQWRGALGLSGGSGGRCCVSSHPWHFLCSLKVWRPRLFLMKAEALLKREHPPRMPLALDMSERGCFLLPPLLPFYDFPSGFLLTAKLLM